MNIGFYLDSISNEKQSEYAICCVENGIQNNIIDDACIFYDSIGFSHYDFPCGIFNATDIWNFSGKLFSFSLECIIYASNIVNNIKMYYIYGWENNVNVLSILDIMSKIDLNVITTSEKDSKEFYRLTGKHPDLCTDHEQLLKKIK